MRCPSCDSEKFFVSCVAEQLNLESLEEQEEKKVLEQLFKSEEASLVYLCCANCSFPLYDKFKGWNFFSQQQDTPDLLYLINKMGKDRIERIIQKLENMEK